MSIDLRGVAPVEHLPRPGQQEEAGNAPALSGGRYPAMLFHSRG